MSRLQTREVHFAASAIHLEFCGDRPAGIVDFLFRHIAASGPAQPHRTYRLELEDDSPTAQLRVSVAGSPPYRHPSDGVMAGWLLGNVDYHLADRSRGGLLFHAGALAWGRTGLILPGTMGAGKTTLTAWLVAHGFDYLSDELTFVPDQTLTVQALARPLNLKHPARPALETYLDFDNLAPHILPGQDADLIQPTLLRPANHFSQPRLGLIIFPRYQADAQLSLERLSKAQAGKALMQCLINARNLPDHGFGEITRLVRQTPAYRLTYGGFAQLGHSIENLVGAISK